MELNILIYPPLLPLSPSLTIHPPLFPLCCYHSNSFHFIFRSLPPLLPVLSPACDHNNASLRHSGNKPGPPSFLCTSPSVSAKPIKRWLNYSCCVCRQHPRAVPRDRGWAERGQGATGCWDGAERTTEDIAFFCFFPPPQSDSHTSTLKTLLYSTHRDEKVMTLA